MSETLKKKIFTVFESDSILNSSLEKAANIIQKWAEQSDDVHFPVKNKSPGQYDDLEFSKKFTENFLYMFYKPIALITDEYNLVIYTVTTAIDMKIPIKKFIDEDCFCELSESTILKLEMVESGCDILTVNLGTNARSELFVRAINEGARNSLLLILRSLKITSRLKEIVNKYVEKYNKEITDNK